MAFVGNGFLKLLGHWRWVVRYLLFPVLRAKIGYYQSLRRLRAKRGEKIRVLFVVGQLSKWKCQSVYDLMSRMPGFEPIIALVLCDVEVQAILNEEKLEATFREKELYFSSRGMRSVRAFSVKGRCNLPFDDLFPDIVFYSQPWGIDECQYPYQIAHRALTFYVPYYVTNLESVEFSCDSPFQRTMFAYVVLNENVLVSYSRWAHSRVGAMKFLALGHPALDQFAFGANEKNIDGYVIFAPHWSIDHPGNKNVENYSTFLDTGELILSYAESHPGIKWLFKPHPTLQNTLIQSGAWNANKVADYYARWEKIGAVCYDGSYSKYFNSSRAMITDCGSFLVEYGCTGQPIIHLISATRKIHSGNGMEKLFESYYEAHDKDELSRLLDEIVLKGNDFKLEGRLMALQNAKLLDNNAAENIVAYIDGLMG